MNKKKHICVVTGTRAEYGLLKPVMQAIRQHPQLYLQILVTGMHLDERFGRSVDLIREDGFEVFAEVPCSPEKDSGQSMAMALGEGLSRMAPALARLNPDILLVLGDRFEIMAAVLAAAYQNIPIAHIHGGDVTRGGLDESVRHAITKFAHLHFPATPLSAERIRKMGEDEWRIHTTGAPGLDTILHSKLLSRKKLFEELGLRAPDQYAVWVQHSVTTQPEKAGEQFGESLQALRAVGIPTFLIYPNSDAGGQRIITRIEQLEGDPQFTAFRNLPHRIFLSLIKEAAVLVGNSSSGIIESSSFGLPVVNIGMRQEGRERAENVLDVAHEASAIEKAIRKALSPEFRKIAKESVNPYGDGKTGPRIAGVLAKTELRPALIQKRLSY